MGKGGGGSAMEQRESPPRECRWPSTTSAMRPRGTGYMSLSEIARVLSVEGRRAKMSTSQASSPKLMLSRTGR